MVDEKEKAKFRQMDSVMQSDFVYELSLQGATAAEVAERAGISIPLVYKLEQFARKAPEEVKNMVFRGSITITAAIQLLQGRKMLNEKERSDYIKEVKKYIANEQKRRKKVKSAKQKEKEIYDALLNAIKNKLGEVVRNEIVDRTGKTHSIPAADFRFKIGSTEYIIEIKTRRHLSK